MTPLKKYPGRKGAAGQWQKILSEIPKCNTFVELMCGSAYISSLLKDSGCSIIINDLEKTVIDKIQFPEQMKMNKDYRAVINKFDSVPGTVFFADPPYLLSTRSYKKDIYKKSWNDNDHIDFLQIAMTTKSPLIISHYPAPMYDDTLRQWRQIEYKSMTRAGIRTEKLYMNFPQPTLLQCHKFIGDNFTDRQRIKRKVFRLINKLNNESPQERAAILSSIIDHFDYVTSKPGE